MTGHPARKPYSGPRTLVIGIDVGTTSSGLSYSILEPGHIPVIRPITRFPGQQDVGGDSKVPTSIFYSREGIIRSQGAETALAEHKEKAEDEGWELARWFKLHLRPDIKHPDIPPLPHRTTAVSVFVDFLRYLFDCAKTYIEQSHPDGVALWSSLYPSIRIVMTHPNGWEGKQQNQMRQAAVMAGLIPGSAAGHARLQFVTEGEASLHFCIQNGLATEALASGEGVVIVDAGGGTVDISTYHQVQKNGRKTYEEIAPPQCLFNGSIYITRRAQDYIEDRLRNSRYRGDIENITEIFDTSAKLSFKGDEEFSFVKFGTTRDDEPGCNIRRGQLKIPGSEVKRFFEPSIVQVVSEVRRQCMFSAVRVSSVFVVGGFAANHYLFSQLRLRLQAHGLDVTRPDAHVNKAVADGAVLFYTQKNVSVRVSRLTHGLRISEPFNPTNAEHVIRAESRYEAVDGQSLIPSRFDPILCKGVQVAETTEFRAAYSRNSKKVDALNHFSTELWIYRGHGEPTWMDVNPVACTIQADTSSLIKKPTFIWENSKIKHSFFILEFEVILSFGLTELRAEIEWDENGVKKRGPAQLIY